MPRAQWTQVVLRINGQILHILIILRHFFVSLKQLKRRVNVKLILATATDKQLV